jgi:hypothetical protein
MRQSPGLSKLERESSLRERGRPTSSLYYSRPLVDLGSASDSEA